MRSTRSLRCSNPNYAFVMRFEKKSLRLYKSSILSCFNFFNIRNKYGCAFKVLSRVREISSKNLFLQVRRSETTFFFLNFIVLQIMRTLA